VNKSGRPPKDQSSLVFKASGLLILWSVLYTSYLIWGGLNLTLNILLASAWALVMISIQLSVMHDASHKSSSERPWVNNLLLNVISLLGGSPTLWVAQHCQAHHSYTNVPGKDHDIDTGGLLRLCDHQEYKPYHRYQHIYAWLLYPLFLLSWVWWGDFRDIKNNTYSLSKKKLHSVSIETFLIKVWHIALFLVVPWICFGSISLVLIGYLTSFAIMGFVMVVVFQLAHVTSVQNFESEEQLRKTDWALFQLASTANFAPNNRFLSWYLGGLNHQIEHHIFPYLSHTHYPEIQGTVKKICESQGVQYHVFPTVREAVYQHQNHLKYFSQK
jgi:linoleoyl-CoA desaturase